MSKALKRLSKILQQAEGSGVTDAERETYMAAATSLAGALGVDLAVARVMYQDATKRQKPEKRKFQVGEWAGTKPGSMRVPKAANGYKAELLTAIGQVYDIRWTIGGASVYCYGHGFPADLDITEALYGVLVVDMVKSCDASVKRGDNRGDEVCQQQWFEAYGEYRDVWVSEPIVHPKVYRANFYEGYTARVVSRLWDARRKAERERDERLSAARGEDHVPEKSETGLILADRKKEIGDFFEEANPHLALPSFRNSSWKPPQTKQDDYFAQARGQEAGARVDLSTDSKVGGSNRKGIE